MSVAVSVAFLIARLILGLGFMAHGTQKLFGAFAGLSLVGTGGFFESIGFRPGKVQRSPRDRRVLRRGDAWFGDGARDARARGRRPRLESHGAKGPSAGRVRRTRRCRSRRSSARSRSHSFCLSDDAGVDAVLMPCLAPSIADLRSSIIHRSATTRRRTLRAIRRADIRFLHAPVFMGPHMAVEATGVMIDVGRCRRSWNDCARHSKKCAATCVTSARGRKTRQYSS